jgi:regulator of protease activity HflC (stomatin/prohibitin superfamily)
MILCKESKQINIYLLVMISRLFPNINKTNKRTFFSVINQAEVAYREFLGQNRVKLEPGLRINLPIIHNLYRVSLKEDIVELNDQDAYTKDNVPVRVSGTVFFKVIDPEKVCFSVKNPALAVQSVGESSFRAVIGRFEYDEIISNRNSINKEMLEILGQTTLNWGINTIRLEIQNFGPQNKEVAKQLEKQMQAERSRRENELQTQTDIRTAEGAKQIAILNSEGSLISAKNNSEALKYELTATSDALSAQLKSLSERFNGDTNKASQYLLEMKRLEHLQQLAGTSNKVYFMSSDGIFPTAKVVTDFLKE